MILTVGDDVWGGPACPLARTKRIAEDIGLPNAVVNISVGIFALYGEFTDESPA